MKLKKMNYIPEILYNESEEDSVAGNFPFIIVPQEYKMPETLFVFESRQTGDFEPDADGNEQPIHDFIMHNYVDMEVLKATLPEKYLDKVRMALGFKKMKQALADAKKKVEENHTTQE